jgi:hypothetical protein
MSLLNPFSATVWATPIVMGVLMSQWLRRKVRPAGRVALWLVYLLWGWQWAVIWERMTSGGSGRFDVENLIFVWAVWGTTALGAVFMAWAEVARRRGPAA